MYPGVRHLHQGVTVTLCQLCLSGSRTNTPGHLPRKKSNLGIGILLCREGTRPAEPRGLTSGTSGAPDVRVQSGCRDQASGVAGQREGGLRPASAVYTRTWHAGRLSSPGQAPKCRREAGRSAGPSPGPRERSRGALCGARLWGLHSARVAQGSPCVLTAKRQQPCPLHPMECPREKSACDAPTKW